MKTFDFDEKSVSKFNLNLRQNSHIFDNFGNMHLVQLSN